MNPLPTNFWSPALWTVMYAIAYSTAKTDKSLTALYSFYESLAELLPCEKCRKHYAEYLHKYPIHAFTIDKLDNKELCLWVYRLEEQVAKTNGKAIEPFAVKWQQLQGNVQGNTTSNPQNKAPVKKHKYFSIQSSKSAPRATKRSGFGIKPQSTVPGWRTAPCTGCNGTLH